MLTAANREVSAIVGCNPEMMWEVVCASKVHNHPVTWLIPSDVDVADRATVGVQELRVTVVAHRLLPKDNKKTHVCESLCRRAAPTRLTLFIVSPPLLLRRFLAALLLLPASTSIHRPCLHDSREQSATARVHRITPTFPRGCAPRATIIISFQGITAK